MLFSGELATELSLNGSYNVLAIELSLHFEKSLIFFFSTQVNDGGVLRAHEGGSEKGDRHDFIVLLFGPQSQPQP